MINIIFLCVVVMFLVLMITLYISGIGVAAFGGIIGGIVVALIIGLTIGLLAKKCTGTGYNHIAQRPYIEQKLNYQSFEILLIYAVLSILLPRVNNFILHKTLQCENL